LTDAWFGAAVALQGDTLAVGAPSGEDSGLVFVYRRSEGTWALSETLAPADPGFFMGGFGQSLPLDGDVLAAGLYKVEDLVLDECFDDTAESQQTALAYVFCFDGAVWNEEAVLEAGQLIFEG